jgi:hypothetical protein
MGLKRKRCPVLPVPHFLLSNVRPDVAIAEEYQAAARTTCSAAELNRRPRYKRAMLALWLMTALGHSRRSDSLPATSVLPRTTDISGPARHVGKVPEADITMGILVCTRPARSRCASIHFLMAYRKAAMDCGKPPRMQDRVSRSR